MRCENRPIPNFQMSNLNLYKEVSGGFKLALDLTSEISPVFFWAWTYFYLWWLLSVTSGFWVLFILKHTGGRQLVMGTLLPCMSFGLKAPKSPCLVPFQGLGGNECSQCLLLSCLVVNWVIWNSPPAAGFLPFACTALIVWHLILVFESHD